jgi:ligand-binding sensor domain-containing protein
MKIKKLVLYGLSVLTLALLLVDLALEHAYESDRQTGWSSVNPPALPLDCRRASISDIGFSKDNRLWVVDTCNGLSIYNGESWESYIPSSSDLHITSGALDDRNRVWLLTFEGVFLFDKGEWTSYTSENSMIPNPYPENLLTSIAFDKIGRAWIGAAGPDPSNSSGIFVFDGEDWINYTPENSGLTHGYVCGIVFDNEDRAWIETWNAGLSVYDGTIWINYSGPHPEVPTLCLNEKTIAIDQQGRVWMRGNELSVFDGSAWTSYTRENVYIYNASTRGWYPHKNTNPRSDTIRAIAIDNLNREWVATVDGLNVSDGTSWTTYTNDRFGLPSNSEITSIAIDNSDIVWLSYNLWSSSGSGSTLIALDPARATLPSTSALLLKDLLWLPHIRWIPLSLLAMLWLGVLLDIQLVIPLGLLVLSIALAIGNRGWAGGGAEQFFGLFLPPVLPTFGAFTSSIMVRLIKVARAGKGVTPAHGTLIPAIVGAIVGLLIFLALRFFGCILGC